MPPNFGFTPPTVQEAAAKPAQKKALPAHLIPKGAIHTGDGFVFQRLTDGSVKILIISPDSGQPQRPPTVLTPAEWVQVRDLVEPPKSLHERLTDLRKEAGADFAVMAGFEDLKEVKTILDAKAVVAAADADQPAVTPPPAPPEEP